MRKLLLYFIFGLCAFLFPSFILHRLGVNTLIIQSEDTIPSLFLPITIIKEKTLYADTYYKAILDRYPHPDDKDYQKGLVPFYFVKIPERFYDQITKTAGIKYHYLSAFPILNGLLALPLFLPFVYGFTEFDWELVAFLGKFASSFYLLISGYILYKLLQKHFYIEEKYAKILTFLYLFGTINYSLIGQSLWQHGFLELFVILSLWFLFERKWFLSSMMLSFAVLSRPTAITFVPFFFLLILSRILKFDPTSKESIQNAFRDIPRSIVFYILGFLPVVLFFGWYTNTFYGGLENNGYADQIYTNWLSRFPEGFLGLWFSPSKGILIYTPAFIFSFVGSYLILSNDGWKKRRYYKYIILLSIVIFHTLIMGKWKHWYGGWSFGYRMASDIIPFLILLISPIFQNGFYEKYKKIFWILFGMSVFVQIFGLVFFDGIWHAAYDRGFRDTAWLWSITDSEFIFNIRRILVKLGMLASACPRCN